MKTIDQIDLKGKTVVLRLDLNVPIQKGKIMDKARIMKSLPTVRYLLEKECKVVILSHLGRPKKESVKDADGKEAGGPDGKGTFPDKFSLQLVRQELESQLSESVTFIDHSVDHNDQAAYETAYDEVKVSKDRIFLLENIRFHSNETSKNPEERKILAQSLAKFGDVFVNDAFGAVHRAHASTTDLAYFLPSAIGLLMEKEIKFLSRCLDNPDRPFVVILGGAKVSDKIALIKNLLTKVEKILIGGGMSYTFLKALGYEVGKSLVDDALIETCTSLLTKYPDKIVLPKDVVITKIDFSNFTALEAVKHVNIDEIDPGEEAFDIGPTTIKDFSHHLETAKTIFWNGPLGVFECESTATGTNKIAQKISDLTTGGQALSIIGGGDSLSALKNLGLQEKISFASSGGGASLEFLEGKELPGLKAIEESNKKS